MRLARIAAVVAALAATAWFVLGVRQAHELTSAQSIISGRAPVTVASASRARSLLSAAAFLNPDSQIDVLRGQLALRQGDKARALHIFEGVVRGEPLNLVAWVATAQ